jgi:hypothetical protein
MLYWHDVYVHDTGKERFPVPDLNVRKGLTAMDPNQETAGFLTSKITK